MICSKCTHESYCDMAQFGGHEPSITTCYKFKKKQQTNGDRIRSMMDDELSQFLSDVCACLYDDANVCEKWNGACDKCWLDWLKQEVENNE